MSNHVSAKSLPRRSAAASLVEVTIGGVVLILVAIVLLDLAFLIYGVSLNDSLCRDAARKAASGSPSDTESRAQAVIEATNSNHSGSIGFHYRLVLPVETHITSQPIVRRDPETDKPFNPGGLVTGSVTVATEIEIRSFAVHLFIGQKSPLKFQSKQSFPIRYVMPAN